MGNKRILKVKKVQVNLLSFKEREVQKIKCKPVPKKKKKCNVGRLDLFELVLNSGIIEKDNYGFEDIYEFLSPIFEKYKCPKCKVYHVPILLIGNIIYYRDINPDILIISKIRKDGTVTMHYNLELFQLYWTDLNDTKTTHELVNCDVPNVYVYDYEGLVKTSISVASTYVKLHNEGHKYSFKFTYNLLITDNDYIKFIDDEYNANH